MYVCRLFHCDAPLQEVEARTLSEGGRITIGRDPSADWSLADPEGMLSRIHCTLSIEDGRLFLVDSSTNGTFLDGGERALRGEPVELNLQRRIQLGPLSIMIDGAEPRSFVSPGTVLRLPLSQTPAVAPQDWLDSAPAPTSAPHRDQSLLEAFCEGAKLDASALSGEDPAELMRRVGAVYQQTILGLATLMSERARVKTQHQLERTVIYAANNNPFKWSPTRRLAQDLLTGSAKGFLSDGAAVRASFDDLAQHMAAVAQGANAATDFALRTLSPETIEAEARRNGSLLRGHAASCWDIFTQRHAELIEPIEDAPGAIAQAFGDAYSAATTDKPA